MIELKAGGLEDPDGQRTASVLAAYFQVEHAHAQRRLLWRQVAIGAIVACVVTATTSLLPTSGLVVALLALGAAAAGAALVEWRAERTLRALL